MPGDATLGAGQLRFYQLTPPATDYDPLGRYDLAEILQRVRFTAAMGDADSPYLSTFASRGKMIVYSGLSDQGMAFPVIAEWYERMVAATGEKARDAVRLFAVPGMLHCGGGEATDQFEMLDAIMDWVEQGRAPDRIAATSKTFAGISRPFVPIHGSPAMSAVTRHQPPALRAGRPDQLRVLARAAGLGVPGVIISAARPLVPRRGAQHTHAV
jgi:feruloyl esterase